MKGMSLTRTRLRVAVRVMRYYNSVPLTEAMPVMAPVRGRANHQFTAGHDFWRLKEFSLVLSGKSFRIRLSEGKQILERKRLNKKEI